MIILWSEAKCESGEKGFTFRERQKAPHGVNREGLKDKSNNYLDGKASFGFNQRKITGSMEAKPALTKYFGSLLPDR